MYQSDAPACESASEPVNKPRVTRVSAETSLDSELRLAPVDYQLLLEELAQAQQRDQERCNRIHDLEQALDQAMICLEELRLQLRDQHVLEAQLSNTEEFSYVQQQAIARLKLQIAEQQQALDAQILETQQRDQAVQELLATIEALTQAQQREVERLRLRIVYDQREVQTHRQRLSKQLQDLHTALESRQQRVSELEAETLAARSLNSRLQGQLETAQQQIKELSRSLYQHRHHLAQLEAQIEQAQHTQSAGKASKWLAGWHRSAPSDIEQTPSLATVQHDLARAQHQVEDLERRWLQHTRWQHHQQELEAERDGLQARVQTLMQQVTEMQEQILQQAQQSAEYETAVQYWKDRYTTSQLHLAQVKELAEQLLTQSAVLVEHPVVADLLNALKIALPPDQPSEPSSGKQSESSEEPTEKLAGPKPITPLPLPRLTSVELPEFLVRRRTPIQSLKEPGMGTSA